MPYDPTRAFLDELSDHLRAAVVAVQDAVKVTDRYRRSFGPGARVAGHRKPRQAAAGPSLRFTGASVSEAAIQLGMTEDHVRRLLRAGELNGVPYSGRVGWRIDREYLAEVVAARAEQRRERDEARRRRQSEALPGRPSKPVKPRRLGARVRPR